MSINCHLCGLPIFDDQATVAVHLKCDGELLEAVRTILRGFDQGVFVRSIDGDLAPDWSLKLIPFVAALGVARRAVVPADATK
jgi:hypothetical protein